MKKTHLRINNICMEKIALAGSISRFCECIHTVYHGSVSAYIQYIHKHIYVYRQYFFLKKSYFATELKRRK
jgi:hypothetical protein